ncbi:hypothetical protein KX928_05905 [Roseobacter sp. YSTF-M11]|uniref:Lipoprotein n=1 Tax=Roseobacter insulae TaxID=2859783 RepID=A0A9X1FTF2_9RHOB|nr:hypothetical protein [Roseobacter insulae]MBW4707317.1 hypothetical protein [Roseobacter insulae]
MKRQAALLVSVLALTACAGARDLDAPPVPLGDFSLGHNVVVAPKVETTATISREVSKDELTAALTTAIAERFDRYEGAKDYHFGVSIEGYVLAKPGVPVLLAPKSGMIIRLTVWDDSQGKKLNEEPAQLTVLEELNGASIVGTGWSQTKETQLENLSRNAAQAIEDYLVKQNAEQGWFSEASAANAAPADAPTAGGTDPSDAE